MERVQRIVESVQTSINTDLFVFESRGGDLKQSSLYTYDGFLNALKFCAGTGLGGKYFYLGQEAPTYKVQEENLEIAITNLALFVAKMMSNIKHEFCNPDLLTCGLPALSQTFEEQNLRVECSQLSSDFGLECSNEFGCACILGILNHYLMSTDKYSGVDFCQTNPVLSICSHRIGSNGEELRWITGMTHWIYFTQQYNQDEWNYIDKLHEFVRGGMIDASFVYTVAKLYVLDRPHKTDDTDQFIQNFFKVIILLSKGLLQTMPHKATQPPTIAKITTTTQPTSPPYSSTTTTSTTTTLSTTTSTVSIPSYNPTDKPSDHPHAKAANMDNDEDDATFDFSILTDNSSPPTADETQGSHPSTTPSVTSLPPTYKRHWDFDGEAWYREYFTPKSRGSWNNTSSCWTFITIIFTYLCIVL